ncbi:FMN-binding negative transcriptional regulator [Rhizobium sp. BK060]|uniref:FMN-binding negative transcriptional regulator n=1 Tax=Rhizobium sp. BK060 TaxID=2587096 RepID=UPI0016191237|nr:FMN-binding negative transcriptional regulator [Rhizobium sp. BK060]MBB3394245.1 transcriptional regulator [Rhizobium sp. BK060]
MYVPKHFEQNDAQTLHELMTGSPLGILITNGSSGLDANHIPFELNPSQGQFGHLHAHVARNNPVWEDIKTGDEVLVVFRKAHAYISPSWYPSKHELHKQVPTWNYVVAHAYGRVVIHDDERYVRGMVARLTRTHEATQSTPWKMTDSPKEFIDTILKAIVGVEIEITKLQGKSKLSQNKEVRDIRNASVALKVLGEVEIGEAMSDIADGKERTFKASEV